ncbi:ABC transporter permease [Serratia quinivorans]|uniref:ABC transporter permease n=1 Tax=Serratia quinivorans TaxID=137545 RepID=UPI00217C7E5E|nr:ABC transporter permease [Serratia quinivorans]CAI0969693.1 Macrolide export ATP-binding/permease protein MacB [Serratia quinivorans]CAI1711521.1 Macrolide export ATP-binding/permease protein MacB [Serratia quinivorans]
MKTLSIRAIFIPLIEAISNLVSLGKRSLLALTGIVIGCAAVIALVNVGHNAEVDSSAIFKGLGTDTFLMQISWERNSRPALDIVLDKVKESEGDDGVNKVAVVSSTSSTLNLSKESISYSLIGTTPELKSVMDLSLEQGRFLSNYDSGELHAVIGSDIAAALNREDPGESPTHKIKIGNYYYTIIGLLQQRDTSPVIPINVNKAVIIPVQGIRRVVKSPSIRQILGRTVPEMDMAQVLVPLTDRLNNLKGVDEVTTVIPKQLIDGMMRQSRNFNLLLTALGIFSLIGGGVGIMNVMLLNIAQRRREIGVRLAIGARKKDIRNLFLLEALVLTMLGACIGAAVGVIAAWSYTQYSDWSFVLSPMSLPLGIGSTLLVGMFFGLYPAIQASRLLPVEALRDD